MIMDRQPPRATRRWSRGVPIGDRGPSESYRPEDAPPSVFGAHQPGIATPVLDHLAFAALDLACTSQPWSTAFLMIRGLGRMERLEPDKESTHAASRVYGHSVSDEEFVELASRYGPWRGYWGYYLRVGGWRG